MHEQKLYGLDIASIMMHECYWLAVCEANILIGQNFMYVFISHIHLVLLAKRVKARAGKQAEEENSIQRGQKHKMDKLKKVFTSKTKTEVEDTDNKVRVCLVI